MFLRARQRGGIGLVSLGILCWAASADAATTLSVPFHRQEQPLSCEIAALKMALGVHGINVSEAELKARLPFDPTPKGNGIWGDPNVGFVGRINGSMLRTGYGVYWDPIANVGSTYATTEVLRHGSAPQLAQHIAAGNPVIIWGYYGRRTVYFWQTTAGKEIKAVDGEHTRVVYGFEGTVANPTRFYLADPLTGTFTWSTAELMHNWSSLNHMAVVVKPARQWLKTPDSIHVWEINTKEKTRHLIPTWDTFVARGGASHKVEIVDERVLRTYQRGQDIS